MNISFSPPDITQAEIDEVVDTLKSGWITTGPKTKLFEKQIAEYCNTTKAVCMNSATACMEMTLRLLGIGEGDEVITSAYTYTSSASVIDHVGAKIVLVDTAKDSFHLDYDAIEKAITDKTKAIIPVDIAGVMCDYDRVMEAVNNKKHLFKSSNEIQSAIGRVAIVADAAHSFGANYKGKMSGEVADFTCFSFHAVKNLTTAEGGAVTWKDISGINDEDIYKEFMLLILHGQSKDALAKTRLGGWEYDIVYPAYKCNMTDIMASLGLAQFKRYDEILERRKQIISRYDKAFDTIKIKQLKHYGERFNSSGHLYLVRLMGKSETDRNNIIEEMATMGIATNVHYKPLPMHTAYKKLGFNIEDFPNSYNQYINEITLPLHTLLNDEEIEYICKVFKDITS
ncbi:DegT/DnrJ/EryC1/StrS aminotransferase family protein [Alkalibaculum bacchi]|uniref:DegT/DnrJ/EryC1/StrS family aminotransferase n=1 Tax=Alkalibaculum bacchi TaxID=645887 RepID=UPI0026EF3BE9|nr:DegT/DnrJ/EryC1/StrS aminotransferase family protein [Alkalibaculum bacchi]